MMVEVRSLFTRNLILYYGLKKKNRVTKGIISDKLSVTISYNSDLSPSAKRILFLLRRISTLKYTKAYALYNE